MSYRKKTTLSLICLFLQLTFSLLIQALDVRILSSPTDILATSKVFVHFDFSPQDCALFKDTIKISSDNTALQVIKWNILAQATTKYFSAFRKNKRIFTQSFTAQIAVIINDPKKAIEQTHLHVAGILGRSNGKNYPYSLVIPLKTETATSSSIDLILCTSTEFSSTLRLNTHAATPIIPHDTLTQEFQLLEKFRGIWNELFKLFTSSMAKKFFIFLDFFIIFLLLILLTIRLACAFLSKPIDKQWFTQGFELLTLLCGLRALHYAAPFFVAHFVSYLVTCALLVEIIGLFCLLTGHEQSIWGKLKVALAWICLIIPFPLITYAYLARNYLNQ